MARREKLLLKREMARRMLARKSYRRYLYYVHGESWRRTRMSDYLADEVQRFVETDTGNAYDILLIETPPQHGKSITISETFPSWYLGRYPTRRIIAASYNEETARRFGRKNREKLEAFGPAVFSVSPGSIWTATEFELDNGWGRMISRGILSGITGHPANLILIDDPIKNREEADSPVIRDRIWEEWQNTLKSRLAAKGKVIVIMTPWHEDDFAARMLKHEQNIRLLRLPVEAERNDPLGRNPGDPLCPELGKDTVWLQQFRESYRRDPILGGARAWQALYLCSPRVEEGNLIRRDWFRFYDAGESRSFGTTVISVDATFKASERSDCVAIEVWSKAGVSYYLRHCINRQMDFPATLQAIRNVRALFPEARYILIEDKANGSAIIQTLRAEFPGIIAIEPKGGKVSRVNAVAPAIESGCVLLPRGESRTAEFIDQFAAFPSGSHDDMVDACTQALNFLLYSHGGQAQAQEEACNPLLQESLYEIYGSERNPYV